MIIFSVYVMKTPRSKKVIYVGCTSNPKKRENENRCRLRQVAKCNPIMEVVATFSDFIEATNYEYALYKKYRSEGYKLFNSGWRSRGKAPKDYKAI